MGKEVQLDPDIQVLRDPSFVSITSFIQLGYGAWVSLTIIEVGLAFGFPAVTVPQLQEANSPIILSSGDESWIASILTLSAPLGSLSSGFFMDKYGRRFMILICIIPFIIGWIYTALATTAKNIIIGRIITGIGCGMAMGIPRVYITEISLPNMRGVIGAIPNLTFSLGLTIQATLGSFLNWRVLSYICAGFAMFLFLVNYFLPETPYYILLKDTEENAKATLKMFRSATYNLDAEIEQLKDYKTENNIRRLTSMEQIKFLFSVAACKPFLIISVYITIAQLSGVSIMTFWTVDILQSSHSSVDSNLGNVLLGLSRLFGGVLASILLYYVAKRYMALTSAFGVGVISISIGLLIHYKMTPNVMPQLLYIMYILFSSIGYYPLPLLTMNEIYPLQIRGLLGGITLSMLNVFIFATSKAFPYIRNVIGIANTIICFGAVSLLGMFFLYMWLPETKGLTLQEIEEYFNARRATLVSQREVRTMQAISSKSFNKKYSSTGNTQHDLKRKAPLPPKIEEYEDTGATSSNN